MTYPVCPEVDVINRVIDTILRYHGRYHDQPAYRSLIAPNVSDTVYELGRLRNSFCVDGDPVCRQVNKVLALSILSFREERVSLSTMSYVRDNMTMDEYSSWFLKVWGEVSKTK